MYLNHVNILRPGKLDLLFRISHLLYLCVCGWSIFIIVTTKHYVHAQQICGATAIHSICMQAGSHYSNAIYTWQIYGAMAVKSGRVITWKAIMTAEAAGLRGSGR